MYDMKIVPDDGSETVSASNENINCIKLLVELKDVDNVDSHLESAGVDSVVRPDEDIAEYKLWDDEHLCVTYTVYASDSATAQLQSAADSFEDRR